MYLLARPPTGSYPAGLQSLQLENEIPTYPSNAMHALQLYPLLPSTQPFQLTDLLGKLPASGKPC